MKQGLRNELAAIAAAGSVAAISKKNHSLALGLGLVAGALAFLAEDRPYSYRGKVALVTGGSRGFGLALAQGLLRQGAIVTLLARNKDELLRAQNICESEGYPRPEIIAADITDPASVKGAVNKVFAAHGRLDILVNNAGAIAAGPFQAMQLEEFQAQLNVHLLCHISMIQAALPYLEATGQGRIINTCSMGGRVPVPYMSTYAASKFALAGFCGSAGTELEAKGIHVTTAFPSLMRTGSPIQAVFKGDSEKNYALFLAGDLSPVSLGADLAAEKVLGAARLRKREAFTSPMSKPQILLSQVFPEIFFGFSAAATKLLPDGTSPDRKLGSDSEGWLERTWIGRSLMERNRKYEKRWNQKSERSAEFNLNLPH
jgi:NAD(P)-dependent dehydrogenase (short-subunit alcohol dehydrogenase family)